MTGVTTGAVDNMHRAWREVLATAEERLGTQLALLTTELGQDGRLVRLYLRNDGRASVDDPRLMDLIVTYRDNQGNRHTLWLPYAEGPLQDNSWTVDAIGNDRRSPGVWDPGEVATIAFRVNPPIDVANQGRWLVLVAPSGISYSFYF